MARKPLARGLDALLSDDVRLDPAPTAPQAVSLASIRRNRYQPRSQFDEAAIKALAESIKAQGLMQPLVVRPRAGGGYELIAGERRLRAALLAGLEAAPVVVRDATDQQALALALVENIQREDLRPLEEAGALHRLREEFGLTQQETADVVGKSREAVANLLRLLNLHPSVRVMLGEGALEMGHARALLSLPSAEQAAAARQAVAKKLTVRQTEALVRRLLAAGAAAPRTDRSPPPDTLALERELAERVGAPVSISHSAKGAGRVTIRFASLDELDGILSRIR